MVLIFFVVDLGKLFGVSWKNCKMIVGLYQLETVMGFWEMETVGFMSDVSCMEIASRKGCVMEVA